VSRRWRVALGLAPALALLATVFGTALFGSLAQSLGHAPAYGVEAFPTLRYYRAVVGDPGVAAAAARTLATALPGTAIGLLLGTALGLALPARRDLASSLVQVPLLVPYVVAVALATVWLAGGGVLARALAAFGLIEVPQDLPRLLDGSAGAGVIATFVWKQVPFTALLVAAVRAGADPRLAEVAHVFGATPWQRLRFVTLPQVMPAVLAAAVITLAYNLGALEVPLLLGGGTRDTLAVSAWRVYGDPDLTQRPQALAIAWSLTAAVVLTVAALLAAARRWLPGVADR
jgi:putative spermidine/putrescine transport system permease protein